MTHEQKLQAVTEDIRKQIPRLMELSEGCEFIYKKDGRIGKVLYPNGFIMDSIGAWFYLENEIAEVEESYIRIIGHEPMLNDVLFWISNKGVRTGLIDNFLLIAKDEYRTNWIKTDLSKPYLKDQSEELIDFLYNILNNKQ